MDHEFSHRLQALANWLHDAAIAPPVQMDSEFAFRAARLLNRAAQEIQTVELLRKEVASLKRTLRGKDL